MVGNSEAKRLLGVNERLPSCSDFSLSRLPLASLRWEVIPGSASQQYSNLEANPITGNTNLLLGVSAGDWCKYRSSPCANSLKNINAFKAKLIDLVGMQQFSSWTIR